MVSFGTSVNPECQLGRVGMGHARLEGGRVGRRLCCKPEVMEAQEETLRMEKNSFSHNAHFISCPWRQSCFCGNISHRYGIIKGSKPVLRDYVSLVVVPRGEALAFMTKLTLQYTKRRTRM